MKQLIASAIVLKRTNYGEADRIIQVITPNHGKLSLMAKGVRKIKSKLAGGVELFSIIDITYLLGKGSIERLIAARLQTHYGNIIKDLNRTNAGYEFIRIVNKITEEEVDNQWFYLLAKSFESLDDFRINLSLIKIWFYLSVFNLTGHSPNLLKDSLGAKYEQNSLYNFDFDSMSFAPNERGKYSSNHIKVLKLANQFEPIKMVNIDGIDILSAEALPLIQDIAKITLDV